MAKVREQYVHTQLIDLASRLYPSELGGYFVGKAWRSPRSYLPRLVISEVAWSYPARWLPPHKRLDKALLEVSDPSLDMRVHVNRRVNHDYLNNSYGRHFLEAFQAYYVTAEALSLQGLVGIFDQTSDLTLRAELVKVGETLP